MYLKIAGTKVSWKLTTMPTQNKSMPSYYVFYSMFHRPLQGYSPSLFYEILWDLRYVPLYPICITKSPCNNRDFSSCKKRKKSVENARRGGSNVYPQSMFWTKIRKIGIPLHTPVLLNKSGVLGGIHFTDMFSCWTF